MFSLYPSFVISIFILSITVAPMSGMVQRVLGVKQIWACSITWPFVAALFVHFVQPKLVWYPLCLGVATLAYVVTGRFGQPWDVLQYLFVGLAVNLFQEKMTIWYPFTSWHGLSTACIMAVMWFFAAMAFSRTIDDRFRMLASLAATRLLVGNDLWPLVRFGHAHPVDFARYNVDCNLFWLALSVLLAWNAVSSLVSSHRYKPVI